MAGRRQKNPLSFSYHGGFTLLELLVVLAILAILGTVAIPVWGVMVPAFALNGAARQIQSELDRIKRQAISENVTFRLAFSETGDNYTVERVGGTTTQQGVKPLPNGIDIRNAITLGFTSRGTASPGTGTVKLCNSKGAGTNIVLSSTGRVRICRTNVCDA